MLADKRILLIVSGGIAAYKALALIRRLREAGAAVRPILTAGGQQFVTPLAAASLAGDKCYTELFDLVDEAEMGHIQLARQADLVLVAPASADLLAQMAAGRADDLASTVLLATDKPVVVCPAMNAQMWAHPATVANMSRLESWGVARLGPGAGELACGESGDGRMWDPEDIVAGLERLSQAGRPEGPPRGAGEAPAPVDAGHDGPALPQDLAGRHCLVTSGPTQEPIDPVRYLGNRSSGRQGHAVAAALAARGARVTLVSGPTHLADPAGCALVRVTTAEEMLSACVESLPADAAICCAAVADWKVAEASAGKRKKDAGAPTLDLAETPDILARLANSGSQRPRLVVGFAAETEDPVAAATAKRARKGADWMLANAVAGSADGGVFGSETNTVHLVAAAGSEAWPSQAKTAVAARLAERLARALASEEATA